MGYLYSFSNGTIICAVFHNILIMIYNYFICIKIHSASLQFSQRRMNKIYAFTHCFLFLWLAITLKNENYLKSSVNNSNTLYIIYTYNCNKEANSCVPSFKQEFLFWNEYHLYQIYRCVAFSPRQFQIMLLISFDFIMTALSRMHT